MRKWEQFSLEELEWLMYDRLMIVVPYEPEDSMMAKEIEEELMIRDKEEE